MLCVDSGASKVTITPEQYHLLPESKKSPLREKNVYLKQADGTKVKILGAVDMEVQVGQCTLSVEVYVAQISDNLLGMNFLRACGAKIDFGALQLVIDSERIDCRTKDNKPLYLKLLTETEIRIPAEHEMVIPVCLADSRKGGKVCLVEPTEKVIDDELMVARVVVDGTSDVIPVRIMNLGPKEKVLKEGTVVARLFRLCEEDVEEECTERVSRCAETESAGMPDHLRELFEQSIVNLDSAESEGVKELFVEYQDVFSQGEFDIGRTKLVKHRIDTQDARPIRQPLRRQSPVQRAEVERQVSELLDKGLIQPSDSPWASPVVLVAKKDGSKRLCLDYRKLNEVQ